MHLFTKDFFPYRLYQALNKQAYLVKSVLDMSHIIVNETVYLKQVLAMITVKSDPKMTGSLLFQSLSPIPWYTLYYHYQLPLFSSKGNIFWHLARHLDFCYPNTIKLKINKKRTLFNFPCRVKKLGGLL